MAGCKSEETDILLKSQPCETHPVYHGGDKTSGGIELEAIR